MQSIAPIVSMMDYIFVIRSFSVCLLSGAAALCGVLVIIARVGVLSFEVNIFKYI